MKKKFYLALLILIILSIFICVDASYAATPSVLTSLKGMSNVSNIGTVNTSKRNTWSY